MTKYEIIAESLQEKVNNGELTLEDARILNDVAYENYADDDTEYEIEESYEDEGVTYEEYLEAMEYELFGEATRLAKEIHKKANEYRNNEDKIREKYHKASDNYDDAFENDEIKTAKVMQKYKDKYKDIIDKGEELKDLDTIYYGKRKKPSSASKSLGREAKYSQQDKYDTLPSKKSLENKKPGKYDLQLR